MSGTISTSNGASSTSARCAAHEDARHKGAARFNWTWRRWHLWLLIVGLLIRLLFCLTVDRESAFGGWDGKEYHAYAESLLALKWDSYPHYFNNIRPPFYPLFLVPFVALNAQAVWHIQLVQCVLGVLQALILARVAGRWAGERAGDWAFVVVLFHPFLIYNSAFVMTETLFITLLWSALLCLQKLDQAMMDDEEWRWLVLSALALGLACLTRPAAQLFLPVAVLWLGWRIRAKRDWLIAFKRMACFTAIVSALLLPIMFINYRAHGEITLAPRAAQSMYALSNSPEYLRMYEAQTKEEYYEIFERLVARYSVEAGTNPETWMAEASDFRQHHSAEWWRLQWYKFKHFWTPWLNPTIFSRMNFMLSLFTVTPLFILAAAELFRRRARYDPFLLLLLGLVAVGYVAGGLLFHVQVRYRIPFVDVTFMILTASLLARLTFRRVLDLKLVRMLRAAEAL